MKWLPITGYLGTTWFLTAIMDQAEIIAGPELTYIWNGLNFINCRAALFEKRH